MRPSEAEAQARSFGRLFVAALVAVLVAWALLLGATRHQGGPVQLTRAQYCGPVPSYYPGVKHGARPAGC